MRKEGSFNLAKKEVKNFTAGRGIANGGGGEGKEGRLPAPPLENQETIFSKH